MPARLFITPNRKPTHKEDLMMSQTRETTIPTVTLNNGVRIPQLGFGVFQVPPEDTQRIVEDALEAGYRHIDTAAAYRNEAAVGAAIAASGIPRQEIFITTKLRNGEQGMAHEAFQDSRKALGIDYVDLYLIHWPVPSQGLFTEAWKAMEKLYAGSEIRAIGVSNFLSDHLDTLLQASEVVPAVNQIEIHPTFQQRGPGGQEPVVGHRRGGVQSLGPGRGPRRSHREIAGRPVRCHTRPDCARLASRPGHDRHPEVRR